mmetsp:Transcript_21117/g.51512  ORF Transcript_21117/g.51512 Transcript_21117/m.51512 type:complete len:212 (-) Transcript_21117:416-1051(-)
MTCDTTPFLSKCPSSLRSLFSVLSLLLVAPALGQGGCRNACSCYRILGVPRDATDAELKQGYFEKSKQVHPDKNPGDPRAHEKFIDLRTAYELLKDSKKRQAYDRDCKDDRGETRLIKRIRLLYRFLHGKAGELAPRGVAAFKSLIFFVGTTRLPRPVTEGVVQLGKFFVQRVLLEFFVERVILELIPEVVLPGCIKLLGFIGRVFMSFFV